jgi:hypothetical protein
MDVRHPIRKNDKKGVLVQTFYYGVFKPFDLFVDEVFKRK